MDQEDIDWIKKNVKEETPQKIEFDASIDDTSKVLEFYLERVRAKLNREVTAKESPTFADNDYRILVEGKLHHFIEVKIRRNSFTRYDTTKMPLRKHGVAEHYYKALKLKSFFVAKFSDGVVAALDLTKEPYRIETQVARYDRGNDTDVYAFYKISEMTVLTSRN